MKLVSIGAGVLFAATTFAAQTSSAQNAQPSAVKVLGCLQGDGSDQKPWYLSGVALPPPPAPAAVAPAPGGGAPAGAPPAAGAAPGGVAAGGPPAGAAAGGQGGGRGGRGGGGRGGAATPAPAAPAAPVPLVDLRLTGGMNMSAWRGMKIEVEGTLGAKPASGMQEIRISSARSVQGVCTPK